MEILENTKDGTGNFMKAHLKSLVFDHGNYTQLLMGKLLFVAKEIWSSMFRRRETREFVDTIWNAELRRAHATAPEN